MDLRVLSFRNPSLGGIVAALLALVACDPFPSFDSMTVGGADASKDAADSSETSLPDSQPDHREELDTGTCSQNAADGDLLEGRGSYELGAEMPVAKAPATFATEPSLECRLACGRDVGRFQAPISSTGLETAELVHRSYQRADLYTDFQIGGRVRFAHGASPPTFRLQANGRAIESVEVLGDCSNIPCSIPNKLITITDPRLLPRQVGTLQLVLEQNFDTSADVDLHLDCLTLTSTPKGIATYPKSGEWVSDGNATVDSQSTETQCGSEAFRVIQANAGATVLSGTISAPSGGWPVGAQFRFGGAWKLSAPGDVELWLDTDGQPLVRATPLGPQDGSEWNSATGLTVPLSAEAAFVRLRIVLPTTGSELTMLGDCFSIVSILPR